MARFTIRMGGVVVESDDAEAVKDLLLAGNSRAPEVAGDAGEAPAVRYYVPGMSSLKFLRALRGCGGGVGSKKLLQLMGHADRKKIGGTVHSLQRVLAGTGYSRDDAVVTTKVGSDYLWFPGKKIDQVIESIEKKLRAGQVVV